MGLIDRELARTLFLPFAGGTLGLVVLVLLLQVERWSRLVFGPGFRLDDALAVLLALTPSLLVLALPLGALGSTLWCFARLAGRGELRALTGLGVSPLRLSVVPLGLGFATALVGAAAAHLLAPAALRFAERRGGEIVLRGLAEGLRGGRVRTYPGLTVWVRGGASEELQDLLILDSRRAEAPAVLAASTGRSLVEGTRWVLRLGPGEIRRVSASGAERLRFQAARFELDAGPERLERTRWMGKLPLMGSGELWTSGLARGGVEGRRMLRDFWRRTTLPAAALPFTLWALVVSFRVERSWLLAAGLGAGGCILLHYGVSRGVDNAVQHTELPVALLVVLPDAAVAMMAAAALVWRRPR